MAFSTIRLDGKIYMIELESFKDRDLVDFAPRATTGSDSILFSELGLYQVIHQTSWHHGLGFPWWTGADSNVYQKTEGYVDTRHNGLVMLFARPKKVSAPAGGLSPIFGGMVRYSSSTILAWSDLGFHKSTDGGLNWTYLDIVPTNTKINHIWTNGEWAFAAVDGNRIYKSNDLSSWSVTGVNANSTDYRWIANHGGYVYCGKDGKNEVYYSSDETLSDLAGVPADDPNVIYIGPAGVGTLGAISFMGNLYVLNKRGEVYRLDHGELSGTKVLDLSAEVENWKGFGAWTIYNSYLVFVMGDDTVYQWNGIRITDISPRPYTDAFPYEAYSKVDVMTVAQTNLFCVAKTSASSRRDLLAWDGVGWHCVATDVSPAGVCYLLHYDYKSQRLFMNTTRYSGVYDLKAVQFKSKSRFIEDDFPTTGKNYLYTSRLDAGFRRVVKSTPSILIEASNVGLEQGATREGRTLRIHYSIDGGAWRSWGGTNGVTNIITKNGVTELKNPLGDEGSSLEYKNIQFRIQLVTNNSSQSPVLESFTLRLLMRPETNYGYSMNIVASVKPEVGVRQVDDRTPQEVIDDLRKVRAKKKPVEFRDPYGQIRKVYISAMNRQLVEKLAMKPGDTASIEARIQLNLVEV